MTAADKAGHGGSALDRRDLPGSGTRRQRKVTLSDATVETLLKMGGCLGQPRHLAKALEAIAAQTRDDPPDNLSRQIGRLHAVMHAMAHPNGGRFNKTHRAESVVELEEIAAALAGLDGKI